MNGNPLLDAETTLVGWTNRSAIRNLERTFLSGEEVLLTTKLDAASRFSVVASNPAPLALVDPGTSSRQADRTSTVGFGAQLEIRRAPLAGCPHLLTDGKGYASGYATLACCCAVGRHLGFPRQKFHGSSTRPRLQCPPADRPSLCPRY